MKQGHASRSGAYGRKVEPTSHAIRPGGAAKLGNAYGTHVTDQRGETDYRGEPLHGGRGYHAPKNKSQRHGSGSQGSY